MKNFYISSIDKFRDRSEYVKQMFGGYGDHESGVFNLPFLSCRMEGWFLRVIASVGDGWEHASASLPHRCPTWEEMCGVKEVFWEPEDCVMQLHPPHSEYVSLMPNCLHLWKPIGLEIPRPHWKLVGGGAPNKTPQKSD